MFLHDPNTPQPIPKLCILFLREESLAILRARIETFFNAGVSHVWLLDPADKRAYTASRADGLREYLNVATLFHLSQI